MNTDWNELLKDAEKENLIHYAYSGLAVLDFRETSEKIRNKIIKKAEKFNFITQANKTGAILELN